jgi:putative selenate reductase FAD-binding subunit
MIEQFHAPGTVREALRLKGKLKGRAVFLAGGTYVNSSDCSLSPGHAISLTGLGLDRIVRTAAEVAVGALCTLQQLIEDRRIPLPLKAAAAQVMSRNIRNMATLGGHVASNLPNSDLIPMLVALDAKVVLAGAGPAKAAKAAAGAKARSAAARSASGAARKIPVATHIQAATSGLITGIVLPLPGRNRLAACRNVRASANARSTLSVAVSITVGRTGIEDPIIALGGLGRHVMRLTAVEKALNGKPLPPADEIQALVGRSVRARADLSGSAAFRRYQAGTVVALALHGALGQRGGRR